MKRMLMDFPEMQVPLAQIKDKNQKTRFEIRDFKTGYP